MTLQMTRIRNDLLLKCLGHISRRGDETLAQFLKRITHVYFQEKNISVIENLHECSNLSVLYLYDNKIEEISNLTFAVNLTHLYLQNNMISKLDGLHRCCNLNKLYLGFNKIIVIENLEKCTELKELHVENQKLPTGEKMLFDPRTLMCLSQSLLVLNISGNGVDSINELACLKSLTQLTCKDNKLTSMKELSRVFGSLSSLWKLEIEGNPVCSKPKFRDRVIIMAANLAMMDGKEITDTSRKFLQNWRNMRDLRKRQTEQDILPPITNGSSSEDVQRRNNTNNQSPLARNSVSSPRQEFTSNGQNGTHGGSFAGNGELFTPQNSVMWSAENNRNNGVPIMR